MRDRFNGNLLFKYQMDDPVAQIMEVTELDSGSSYILVSSIEGNGMLGLRALCLLVDPGVFFSQSICRGGRYFNTIHGDIPAG